MPSRCNVDVTQMQVKCNLDANQMQIRCNIDATQTYFGCNLDKEWLVLITFSYFFGWAWVGVVEEIWKKAIFVEVEVESELGNRKESS